ncbi:fibronectin type III-like domain-contianing protein [Photobacterium leiognathi]|uniref:fibronectin type III-like domain-contianing protein n=1 Tax=Photobacterium leiognathi TaxID=553611 RepID=UPI0029810010|nr:fibronectin type III-like domain-contianing protein [Photobacterium leiognathi]
MRLYIVYTQCPTAFQGAAWGTRDVSQGPLELFMSMQEYTKTRDLLKNDTIAGFIHFDRAENGEVKEVEYLLQPADKKTGIKYRLLPASRSIISEVFSLEMEHSHIAVLKERLVNPDIEVALDVRNISAVEMHISQTGTSTTRLKRELKGFAKQFIAAGEETKVRFTITADELAFYGVNERFEQEATRISIFIGKDSNAKLSTSLHTDL